MIFSLYIPLESNWETCHIGVNIINFYYLLNSFLPLDNAPFKN